MALQMVQVCNEQEEHSKSASVIQPLTKEPEFQTTLGTEETLQDRNQSQNACDTVCNATDKDSNDSEDNCDQYAGNICHIKIIKEVASSLLYCPERTVISIPTI